MKGKRNSISSETMKYVLQITLSIAIAFWVSSCSKNEACNDEYDIFLPMQFTASNGDFASVGDYWDNVRVTWPEKSQFGKLDQLPLLPYSDTAVYFLEKDTNSYKIVILTEKELKYVSRACGFRWNILNISLLESEIESASILPPSDYDDRPFWVLNFEVDTL